MVFLMCSENLRLPWLLLDTTIYQVAQTRARTLHLLRHQLALPANPPLEYILNSHCHQLNVLSPLQISTSGFYSLFILSVFISNIYKP